MAKTPYKLSAQLFGHKSDVRAVAVFEDGTIVSTSRDKTARVWKPIGNGRDYTEAAVLTGHSHFVSSVCILNPSEQYPSGVIITGSNDNTICVYPADQTKPIQTIKAHKDTVCSLTTSKESGAFLSSSWDLTAKLWYLNDLSKPKLLLNGHSAAVWCVTDLKNGSIVTGAADKLVIVWSRDGSLKHKLEAHTDCVRDVTTVREDEFLTCSNDATVRHWNAVHGTCLGTYSGHANFIYSIAAISDGSYVFTSAEDWTTRVWHNGEIDQTLILPSQSIWCLDLKKNNDIVTGSSDGVIRIFSANPERYADEEVLQQYDVEITKVKQNADSQLGGIKKTNLPGPIVLESPGKLDGENIMVNHGDSVKAYTWSEKERKWKCVGDVMGASGGSNETSGKVLYNGKEYDYVFSVDIQEGAPPLKLPYNLNEDPWHVAYKFLQDNELSPLYLDQIANFILKNSTPSPELNTTQSQYVDPFTGGSRYIPVGAPSSINTQSNRPTASSSDIPVSTTYIPHGTYLRFEQANPSAILAKLREFNTDVNIPKVDEEKLEAIVQLIENKIPEELISDAIKTLMELLNWPDHKVFPALDIARLVILNKQANDLLCTSNLLIIIKKHLKMDALPTNQMLTFRILANMFCHEKGAKLALDFRDNTLKSILDLTSIGTKHNQTAISTYILNLTIALNKLDDLPGKSRVLNVMLIIAKFMNEPEAIFRTLVGLGTLITGTTKKEDREELTRFVRQSENIMSVLQNMSENTSAPNTLNDKIRNCSTQIIDLLLS